jgi:hypothetical protein
MATAFDASGSGLFSLRSLNIAAVAKGDDDQMMRTRGKVRVRRTSLDWTVGAVGPSCSDGPPGFFFGGYLPVGFA